MTDTATQFFTGYTDFHRAFLRHLNAILAPYGLTSPQLVVLRRLHSHGPLTLGSLTQMHGVEAPTMTALVKNLAALGLVATGKAEGDRRRKHVELTSAGLEVFERARQALDAFYAVLLRDFSEQEVESAARLFDTMRRALPLLPRSFSS